MRATHEIARQNEAAVNAWRQRKKASIDRLALTMPSLLATDGGCTLDYDGEPYTRGGFAVGMGKRFNATVKGRGIGAHHVTYWLEAHWRDGVHFGAWYDKATDTCHLDLVEIHQKVELAARAGKPRGERYIWDFAGQCEVAIA